MFLVVYVWWYVIKLKFLIWRCTRLWLDIICFISITVSWTWCRFLYLGLQIAGAGTLMGGINFIATIVTMRAPGMTYMRMPLFTWSTLITSVLILFAFPALTINLFLLM